MTVSIKTNHQSQCHQPSWRPQPSSAQAFGRLFQHKRRLSDELTRIQGLGQEVFKQVANPVIALSVTRPLYLQPTVVKAFYKEWNAWWSEPKKSTAESLLTFLEDRHHLSAFQELAEMASPPYPGAVFMRDYRAAVAGLRKWSESGAQPEEVASVSQLLRTVYVWIAQGNGASHRGRYYTS